MFEEGNLLKFEPFLFKNGAVPKPKYFIVLKDLEGDMLLASLPTFIYGADIDTYPLSVFEKQLKEQATSVSLIGKLQRTIFQELKDCLKSSRIVKNKFRRLL